MSPKSGPTRLRELQQQRSIICSLGAHDVFTPLIVEQAGFETVFIGGLAPARHCLVPGTAICITSAPGRADDHGTDSGSSAIDRRGETLGEESHSHRAYKRAIVSAIGSHCEANSLI